MKQLTEKQEKVLAFIFDFISENDMPPTISEIAEHLNIKGATVFAHLAALKKKNMITRSSKARSIKLINKLSVRKKLNNSSRNSRNKKS